MAEELLDKVRDVVEGQIVRATRSIYEAEDQLTAIATRTLRASDVSRAMQPSCSLSQEYVTSRSSELISLHAYTSQAHRLQRRIPFARHCQVPLCGIGRHAIDVSHYRSSLAVLQQESGQVATYRICIQHRRDMMARRWLPP